MEQDIIKAEEDLDNELQQSDKQEAKAILKLKNIFSKAASDSRQKAMYFGVLTTMARTTRYSQYAEKCYWDIRHNEAKSDADYDKAERVLNRGMDELDAAANKLPNVLPAIMQIKKGLYTQLLDIKYLRKGIHKSPDELKQEVENMTNGAVQ